MKDVDIVFHTSALKHVDRCELNPFEAVTVNTIGTYNICKASLRESVSKVINISTDKAVNPVGVLGATKLLSEKLISSESFLNKSKTIFSSVRFGNVLQTRGSIMPRIESQIKQGGPITLTDKKMQRFFMTKSQSVELILKAAEYAKGGETFVLKMPLILLNDLIQTTNEGLSADQQISPFSLFSVTPIGLALVTTGIIYFVVLGKWVLPGVPARSDATSGQSMKEYLKRLYGLKADIIEIEIPEGNILLGQTLGDLMDAHHCYVIGTNFSGKNWIAPPLTTLIQTPCRLAVLGREKVIREMVDDYGLKVLPALKNFSEDFAPTKSGVAEVVVPPDSALIGKDARELSFRKTYQVSMLAIHRSEETYSNVETDEHEASQIWSIPFKAGDTLVIHTSWEALTRLTNDRNFVVVTTDFPREELRPQKVGWALLFFLIADETTTIVALSKFFGLFLAMSSSSKIFSS